jgi:hypothetical protein
MSHAYQELEEFCCNLSKRVDQLVVKVAALEGSKPEPEDFSEDTTPALDSYREKISALERAIGKESQYRNYYQSMVYDICNIIDRSKVRGEGHVTSGCFDYPSTEVQDCVRKVFEAANDPSCNPYQFLLMKTKLENVEDERKRLKAEVSELKSKLKEMAVLENWLRRIIRHEALMKRLAEKQ